MKYNTLRGVRNYVVPVIAAGLTACAGPRSMTPSPSMSGYNSTRLDMLAAEVLGRKREAVTDSEIELLNELLRKNGLDTTFTIESQISVPGRIDPDYNDFVRVRSGLEREVDANRDGRVENKEVDKLLEKYKEIIKRGGN